MKLRLRGRTFLGLSFCAVGLSLLVIAGSDYAQSYIARDKARAAWERARAHAAVTETRLAIDRASGWNGESSVPPGTPVARLVIPRLGVDEVVVEGVGESELRAGPGHMTGSALPGVRGNSVISAHRDRHFRSLGSIAIGDTVFTETLAEATTWIVTGRRIVKRGAPALHETDSPALTLTTCWPIRLIGPAPDRLLVQLRPAGRAMTAAASDAPGRRHTAGAPSTS